MLLGAAGKATDYGTPEVQALQILAETIWKHTIQRRQEAVIHRLSEALGQSPHTVVITDSQAQIIYVNQAFSESSGHSAAEGAGRNPASCSRTRRRAPPTKT